MLVNGIFGVIIKVGTLCGFQNESFDDFFLSALVLTSIYCQKTGSPRCLCVGVAGHQYIPYIPTQKRRLSY